VATAYTESQNTFHSRGAESASIPHDGPMASSESTVPLAEVGLRGVPTPTPLCLKGSFFGVCHETLSSLSAVPDVRRGSGKKFDRHC